MSNATLSNARNMILNLSGSLTGARQVLVPDGIEKFYIVRDQTTRNGNSLTIKTVSGSGFAIETSGQLVACYSDGTNVVEISLNTLTGTIATAQIDNLAITEAKLASFAVTSARVASFAVTTNKLATNAVTAVKITQSTITQAKLAANSVGSNQLISTGVTASTYTSATITVDADGRITSASSGSGGAGGFVPTLLSIGPATGTYTASSNANRILAFGYGGQGGSGGHITGYENHGSGGVGGLGGFGYYNIPVAQPYSQPYTAAATGNAGSNVHANTGNPGNSGGTTTLGPGGSVFSITGGNGGNGAQFPPGNPGNTGTATPSGSLSIPSSNRNFYVGGTFGDGGAGKIIIFENIGT
jgi:hypothetical protein